MRPRNADGPAHAAPENETRRATTNEDKDALHRPEALRAAFERLIAFSAYSSAVSA